jgi:hypothetical protein
MAMNEERARTLALEMAVKTPGADAAATVATASTYFQFLLGPPAAPPASAPVAPAPAPSTTSPTTAAPVSDAPTAAV